MDLAALLNGRRIPAQKRPAAMKSAAGSAQDDLEVVVYLGCHPGGVHLNFFDWQRGSIVSNLSCLIVSLLRPPLDPYPMPKSAPELSHQGCIYYISIGTTIGIHVYWLHWFHTHTKSMSIWVNNTWESVHVQQ